MKLRWVGLVASVWTIAACSGGDDGPKGDAFEGIYEATSQTENDDACDVEGGAVTPIDPFFELDKESFFGTPILGYHGCTSADPATCAEDADLFGSFYEKRDGLWTGVIKFASWGGTYCLMGETVRTLDGDPEADISISSAMSTTTAAGITESECVDSDLDVLIEEYREDLVCENLDVLHATVVPEE